jgi:hypothetical protein
MTQEALKMALEALEEAWYHVGTFQPTEKAIDLYDEARTAIKEALAQTQEPVAWRVSPRYEDSDGYFDFTDLKDTADTLQKRGWTITPLYTTPPQRTWVGIEGEEIRNLWEEATKPDRSTMTMVTSFAKSIEAKLKQKNGYTEEKNT